MQRVPLAAQELDDGESNRIWTPRGTGSEDAVRAIVDRGRAQQLESFRAIEDPYNEQVRESLDVGEAGFEFWQDFEDAFGFVFGARTFGDLLGGLVGSFGVSDGLRGEHMFRSVAAYARRSV